MHAAAIPAPVAHPAHVVFHNNLMSAFNAVEAAVRWEVARFVHVSSETAPGWFFAERPFLPDYLPVDEQHPLRPQDPYALSKVFGEQLMDAAVRRSDIRCISIRPSWVQWEGNIERNLGPLVRGEDDGASSGFWAYTDAYDLAQALRLAAESDAAGPRGLLHRPGRQLDRPAPAELGAATTATRSSCVAAPARRLGHHDRQGAAAARLARRTARGATTWTPRGGCVPRRLSGSSSQAATLSGCSTRRGSSVSRAMTRRWICDVPS